MFFCFSSAIRNIHNAVIYTVVARIPSALMRENERCHGIIASKKAVIPAYVVLFRSLRAMPNTGITVNAPISAIIILDPRTVFPNK